MASEHSPVLFPPRPALAESLPSTVVASDAKTLACQLIHTLTATLGTPHGLNKLTEILGFQLGAEACLLLWHHQPTNTIAFTCWHDSEATQLWQLPSGHQSAQAAWQRRAAMALMELAPDASATDDGLSWQESLNEILRIVPQSSLWLRSMRSHGVIPCHRVPNSQGVVVLLSRRCQPPFLIHETLAANVASVVAVALHQHQLHHQAQHHTEQLRYLNYLKEDFVSTLNHELRTPLTSMMLALRMLRRPDLTPERATLYLDILEQQCSREINLVNDLLMLQTVDRGATQTSLMPVNLVSLLAHLGAEARDSFAQAQLALVLNLPVEPLLVSTSATQLGRAVQELLTNARKYSAPGSTVTLTLAKPPAGDRMATLQVTNVGAGIQADELPYIFDKFARGHNATKNAIPGTGAGLALVRGVVRQIGGTIAVSSQPIGEQLWQTCFTVEFELHSKSTQEV